MHREEFKVKIRGVRGSYPCANKRFLKYGGNTACVEVNVGGHLIVFDAGTGIIGLGEDLLLKHLSSGTKMESREPITANIFLSHIHQDHILGFTFFSPVHISSSKINVFGTSSYNNELADDLAQLLFTKSFPMDLGDIAADMNIYGITESDTVVLRAGCDPIMIRQGEIFEEQENDVIVTAYKSYAHPQDGVMVYKIFYKGKTLVYATDKESYLGGDRKLINFAQGCDLLIHDAQYTTEDYLSPHAPKQGFGHSTFDMALECQNYANAKKMIFYHFNPSYDDEKMDNISKLYGDMADKADFAYEGMEINLL